MKRWSPKGAWWAWAILACLASDAALAQVYVYPRRPNKSQVRYYDFEWQHVDILVGPEADTRKANDLKRQQTPAVPWPPDEPGPTTTPHVPPSNQGTPTTNTSGPEGPSKPPAFPTGGESDGVEMLDGGVDGGIDAGVTDAGISDNGMSDAGLSDAGVPPSAIEPGLDGGIPENVPFFERELIPAASARELLGKKSGGVRLFFYKREQTIAERAAAMIIDSYVYLVGQFDYVPTETFPYILYSSYEEFLQTNLFPLQEGTLGVTSPIDLKLTLPYFGDDLLFKEVSTHEMAHQFTIQKVRTLTDKADLWGDPLNAMPLWFVEGLAEYYAKRGIDPEAEMLVRDIVINPDFELGYVLLDFYEDRPWSVLWTYKMGQVRCAFLEEEYGRGMVQRIIEASPQLVGDFRGNGQVNDFRALLARLTGDDPKQISAKFEAWLKRRAFRTYLASAQSTPSLEQLEDFGEKYVDALQTSPSGNLLLTRSMDPDTGQSRLVLFDRRAPSDDQLVAVDGVPGIESLHPVWGRNFTLTEDRLAFVSEVGGSDVIYQVDIRHQAKRDLDEEERIRTELGTFQVPDGGTPLPPPKTHELWNVDLGLSKRKRYVLDRKGLIAAYAPSFSPDGKRLAFIGFDFGGNRDVYVLDPDDNDPDGFRLTRLTDDIYSERELSWGPDGIVYNSDATSHGRYNLFRIRPDTPLRPERLTTEARDDLDPIALPDGRIFFTAYDRGRANLHEVKDGVVIRRTDVATGLFDVSPGHDGGVWALHLRSGRRWPVFIPQDRLLTKETLAQSEPAAPHQIPEHPLSNAQDYHALSPHNWELGPPFGFLGGGSGGIWGQVVASASDKLNNHALLLNVSVLGSFELTDGYLIYLNQERRVTWGTGLFQSLIFQVDQSLEDIEPQPFFISTQRFWGALGSLRYPINQFIYVQGDLSVGGVNYFLTSTERQFLNDGDANGTGQDLFPLWQQRNNGTRFQTEVTGRFGYDTIRYSAGGPLSGSSFLLEGSADFQPIAKETFGTARLDAERYFQIYGQSTFFLRLGLGSSFGGVHAPQFALSTFDTIRGIPYGNLDFSVGRYFLFSTAEVNVPLNALIKVLILTNIEAVGGVDFGGVGRQSVQDAWDHRVLSPVVGVNFGLGPLILRLHFAKPLGIGAPAGLPSRNGEWVTNFSIRILGYEGLFDGRGLQRHPRAAPRTTLVGEAF